MTRRVGIALALALAALAAGGSAWVVVGVLLRNAL